MAKKVSDRERLLAFAMTATKEQLEEAVEIMRTGLRSRFMARKKSAATAGEKSSPPKAVAASRASSATAKETASAAVANEVGEHG